MIIKLDPVKVAKIENQQRSNLRLSLTQLLTGLVKENWITSNEGLEWSNGVLPAKIISLIEELPIVEQFTVKSQALAPSISRLDTFIILLGNLNNKTPSEMDDFFKTYLN